MLTHVDLFSGIGGFALACRWAGVETVAFAEIDDYASRVLQRHFPRVRNYGDVRNVPALSAWLLTGGVPCQPASVAGKRRGTADDRWLWPETLAVIANGNYEWLLLENPTGILSLNDGMEFERICAALEGQGYEVQPLAIPACAVNAEHERNRLWLVAHADKRRQLQSQGTKREQRRWTGNCLETNVAHANQARHEGRGKTRKNGTYVEGFSTGVRPSCIAADSLSRQYWNYQPVLGGRLHGVSNRLDRIAALGNSIVPQVAYQLIKRMKETSSLNEPAR